MTRFYETILLCCLFPLSKKAFRNFNSRILKLLFAEILPVYHFYGKIDYLFFSIDFQPSSQLFKTISCKRNRSCAQIIACKAFRSDFHFYFFCIRNFLEGIFLFDFVKKWGQFVCFITKTKTGLFGTPIKIDNPTRIVNFWQLWNSTFLYFTTLTNLNSRIFRAIFFAKVKRRARLETILFESKNMQKKMLLIFDIFESNVLTCWSCRRMNYAHEWVLRCSIKNFGRKNG